MKILYNKLHPFIRVCIYLGGNFLLIFLVQFAGAFGEMTVNLLLCLLVIGFTKWILYLENSRLNTTGWRPFSGTHWLQLLIGTIIGMSMLVGVAFFIKWQTGFTWESTPLSWDTLTILFITVLASAYSQELIFRGYPFQLLLKKYGVGPAQIIMAIFFGLMHIGNMSFSEIAGIMFTTGLGAILFGLAYIKTKNLALPTGIHFGWNFLQILFPRHPSLNGKGIVKIVAASFDEKHLNVFIWIMPYVIITILTCIGLNLFYKKKAGF